MYTVYFLYDRAANFLYDRAGTVLPRPGSDSGGGGGGGGERLNQLSYREMKRSKGLSSYTECN